MNKKILFFLSLFSILFSLFSTNASPVWAECSYVCCDPDNCINPHTETSPPYTCIPDKLCCETCGVSEEGGIINPVIGLFGTQPGQITIATILATFLRISLVVAGILLLIYLVIGGIQWLTSGGEKAALESARGRLTNAFIGLLIIVLVLVIIDLINRVLGLDILRPELPTPPTQ